MARKMKYNAKVVATVYFLSLCFQNDRGREMERKKIEGVF